MKNFKFTVLILTLNFLSLYTNAGSAHRDPQKGYREYFLRSLLQPHLYSATTDTSAVGAARDLAEITESDWAKVSEWDVKPADLKKIFRQIRDERVIPHHAMTDDRQDFARRPSWMYPYDGCFARAEVMADRLEKLGAPKPTKIFVFGSLNVKTTNAPEGSISWWYHVTIAYRINDQIITFDPAIEALKPVTFEDWASRMTDEPNSIQVSLCDRNAYEESSGCYHPKHQPYEDTLTQQRDFLDLEWSNIVSMDRNPIKELGDFPPWLKP